MSVSRWRWTPECDKGICIGDCDRCDKAEYVDTEEKEMDPLPESYKKFKEKHGAALRNGKE